MLPLRTEIIYNSSSLFQNLVTYLEIVISKVIFYISYYKERAKRMWNEKTVDLQRFHLRHFFGNFSKWKKYFQNEKNVKAILINFYLFICSVCESSYSEKFSESWVFREVNFRNHIVRATNILNGHSR